MQETFFFCSITPRANLSEVSTSLAHQDWLQKPPAVQLLPALPVVTCVRAQESGRVVIVAALLAALLAAAIEDKQLRQISPLDTSIFTARPKTPQGSSFISLGLQRETKEVPV